MKIQFSLGLASFLSILVSCGGSVRDPIDDDDSTRPPGDGDASGDGDSVGDGDGDSPGDGDGDFGDGDSGDGDYSGDGDVSVGGSPIGGSPVGGSGGIIIRPPSSGGSHMPGSGGSILPGTGGTVDPGECKIIGKSEDRYYCNMYAECENGWVETYCEGYDAEAWCGCNTGNGYVDFQVRDVQPGAQCEAIFELCRDNPFEVIDRDPVCERVRVEQGRNYCATGTECRSETKLPGGGTASVSSWRDVWCDQSGDTWTCNCNGNNLSLRMEFETDREGSDVCNDIADNVCNGKDLEVTGEATCEPSYQSSSRDWCDVELECGVPAQINGVQADILQYQWGNCYEVSDNLFECSCNAGKGVFQKEAESGFQACNDLAELCKLSP